MTSRLVFDKSRMVSSAQEASAPVGTVANAPGSGDELHRDGGEGEGGHKQ
jgi:hypothetical protein